MKKYSFNNWFEINRDYGSVLLRILIGAYLIYMQHDNVFNNKNMIDVEGYFRENKIPIPVVSAYLSVFAQFFCGVLIMLGAFVRYASAVLVFNFIIAFIAVDFYKTYPLNFPAQIMLSSSLLFLFQGAGKLSIDDWLKK